MNHSEAFQSQTSISTIVWLTVGTKESKHLLDSEVEIGRLIHVAVSICGFACFTAFTDVVIDGKVDRFVELVCRDVEGLVEALPVGEAFPEGSDHLKIDMM